MRTPVLSGLFSLVAFFLFLHAPNVDTFILAWAGMLPLAVWSEVLWEKLKAPPPDAGPLCPTCGYDTRATPTRCPECGELLEQSPTHWPGFSPGAVYDSLTRRP